LLAADAGKLVRDADELRAVIVALAADRDARRALGIRAQRVVEARRGATARNFELLAELLRARP
jgi:3-deoxy-D-manno-octulosonic-acid transferase